MNIDTPRDRLRPAATAQRLTSIRRVSIEPTALFQLDSDSVGRLSGGVLLHMLRGTGETNIVRLGAWLIIQIDDDAIQDVLVHLALLVRAVVNPEDAHVFVLERDFVMLRIDDGRESFDARSHLPWRAPAGGSVRYSASDMRCPAHEGEREGYSAFAPEVLTTFAHFSVSLAMSLPGFA